MECPFDITNKKQVIEFCEVDPYNPQNTVEGYVNRRQGQLYGALWITMVNGERCEQLIYSAPKQHYPFDGPEDDRIWKFPEYDTIELYEKIDGTCIISYVYTDGKGNTYLTYKTRLRPFLGSGKYGNFFELWNEMREKYSNIDKICNNKNYNYVFELYGKRNKILIDYDVSLDTKLIFSIYKDGRILSPMSGGLDALNLPVVIGWLHKTKDTKKEYLEWMDRLENSLDIDEHNCIMKGKEGLVWYFVNVGGFTSQIKCKPPSVLKYHWSGDAIPYESVYTTVINAFENFDEPTYEDVVSLLEEEYTEDKISKSRVRIEKCLGKVLFDRKYQYKLAEDYRKHNFNINKDKVTCMRYFGKHYPKSEAKRIYRLLKQYEEES